MITGALEVTGEGVSYTKAGIWGNWLFDEESVSILSSH